MKNTLYAATLTPLLSTAGWAHSGHSHAAADTLTGLVHTLMTHPSLFGVIGLLLLGFLLYKRQ